MRTSLLLAAASLGLSGLWGCDDDQTADPPDVTIDAGIDAAVDMIVDAAPDLAPPIDAAAATIRITAPTDGQTIDGAADLDGDLANGVQLEVRADATGADDGRVVFRLAEQVVEAALIDDRAVAVVTLPASDEATLRLTAEIVAGGRAVADAVDVTVRVRTCALSVAPLPGGGACDAGPAADLDPERAGVQIELRAESDCARVTATVDGVPSGADVIDGVATLPITLAAGETPVELTATAPGAHPTRVGPLTYRARTAPPTVALDARQAGETVRGLAAAEVEGERAFWTFAGQAEGVEPGDAVSVLFVPPLDGAPVEARVDAEGRFTVEAAVALGAVWVGEVTVAATDACGTLSRASTHPLRLDAVTPRLRITSPPDGVRLTPADDVDPERLDIQVPLTVEVDDPREGLDYRVSVACGPPGAPRSDRAVAPADATTRAAGEPVIVTIRAEERGEIVCAPIAEATPNPIEADETLYRLFFDTPRFAVEQPAPDAACLTGAVRVAGQGALLAGNQPALTVTATGADGVALAPVPLAAQGDERYAVDLEPVDLPDGRWTLRVEGTVFGRIPIEVVPAAVAVEVDRTAPTARFLAPAAVTGDVDPATPGVQFTPRLEVCGAGGQTLTLALDPALSGPYTAEVPAGECGVVTLPTLTAPLGEVRLDAEVADACGQRTTASATTALDPLGVGARILDPADGERVSAALDDDPATPGCQFTLDALVTGPGADAAVEVCTAVAQGNPAAACDGQSSALRGDCEITGVAEGGSTLRCPISLTDDTHRLTLAVDGGALTSPPVQLTVDCSAPTVEALAVEGGEDGCVNRDERLNAGEAGANARVRVTFETTGLAPETALRLRTDGGLDLGGTTAGAGEITASLPPGLHRLYLRGQDTAGNALPEDDRARRVTVEVDTSAPSPTLVEAIADTCLAAADDDDPADGLQTTLRIRTGDAPGAASQVTVTVDGAPAAEGEGADVVALPLTLADGERTIEAVVRDACGNVGRLGAAVRVDTIAPRPALLGLDDGAVLDADDDADGDDRTGFQLDVLVALDAPEPAQLVEIDADDAPARTEPSPLVFDGLDPLPARLTLSGGDHTLVARSTDACGNTGESDPIALTIDLPGCASRITTPAAVLGLDDIGAGQITIEGVVDLLDLDCRDAEVAVLRDGAVVGIAAVGDGGAVRFDAVPVLRGEHAFVLRVGPVRGLTRESAPVAITIDREAPRVVIVQPPDPDPAAITVDERPDIAGLQTTIRALVLEDVVDSPREATVVRDGVSIATRPDIGEQVELVDVTLPPGEYPIDVCVTDAAGQTGCARRIVNVDPAPPGGIGAVDVVVVDPRATRVELTFTAPGDDGSEGTVSHYAVRRSASPFAGEADWAAAAATEITLPATAAARQRQTLRIEGPGPTLADGLALDELHHVALRPVDDVGRLGPITSVVVDLRFDLATGLLAARGGVWEAGALLNTTSPVIGVGDLDDDGFDDLLVTATQSASASGAAIVFGGPAPTTRSLALAPGMTADFFGVAAAAAGDLDGDGAPDIAVQGYTQGLGATAIALYFGCTAPGCDRAAIAEPDALLVTDGGRFTNSLAGIGDVGGVDDAGLDDLFVGGGFGGAGEGYIVPGRAVWPALPAALVLSPDPPAGQEAGVAFVLDTVPVGVYAAGVGDIDRDGFDDFALSAGDAINESFLVFGGDLDGEPRVQPLEDPCGQASATFGTAFAGGVDLDGDDQPDFVVGNRANKRIVVLATSLSPLDCFGRSPSQFGRVLDLAGDIDGDGAIDLVATHGDPLVTDAWVFYNDGLGRFGVGAQISPRGAHVRLDRPARRKLGVAGIGDFDGDRRDDLAAIYLSADGEMTWVVYR